MFGVVVAVAVALVAFGCLSSNKFFISFIIIFSCKLHGITMNCYIINRKADDFRTSGFTVTVTVCVSLRSCAWVVCSVCVLCGSSAVCASSAPSASAYAVLCLCWVVHPLLRLRLRLLCLCLVCVCCACASSASSVARLRRLCLCLVRFFCGLSASAARVPVPASFSCCVSAVGFFFIFTL